MRHHRFAPLGRIVSRGQLPSWLVSGLVILSALPALWPFYSQGLPRSFDGGLHLLRIALLHRHLMAGDLFPRWVAEQILGHGYPLFSFYAPSSYYLVEVLHLGGLSFYHAFVAAFALLVVAAGLGMAWLARDVFGPEHPWAAVVAAVAYIYAPYLLTNVYIRGALAEVGAQALLPWILWSARRLLRDERPTRYVLPLMLTLGGLAITHNITLLFTPPLLLGYGALHWFQTGRSLQRLRWFVVALVGAMGISAFFWLPLLVERSYLADTAYAIAKEVWLPGSVWRWSNFLDPNFFYQHTFDRPIRLGLVQLGLALAGFVLARRRSREWVFFGVVALVSGALMGAWSLPLWQSNDILPVAQFAWRLLSILSLPMALFVGGLVWRLESGHGAVKVWPVLGALAVIALVIVAQRPRLAWMDVFAADTVDLAAPVFAQVEVDKGVLGGGEGNSSIQEFRPRWAAGTLVLDPETVAGTSGNIDDVTLQTTGPRHTSLTVSASAPSALRVNQFYYPGWRVRLDGATELSPYPSTNLGLLTVDLPAGRHEVRVEWVGTPLQRWAGWISLVALLILIGLGWRLHTRTLATLSLIPLVFGLAATFVTPPARQPVPPTQPLSAFGVTLSGFQVAPVSGDRFAIHPTWLVTATPPADLRVGWRLVGDAGVVIATAMTRPYYNTTPAYLWPTNTLVSDAYLLPVPDGLPAGVYGIEARLDTADAATVQDFQPVGELVLDTPVLLQPSPSQAVSVGFGDVVDLIGYETAPATPDTTTGSASDSQVTDRSPLLVVDAGDYLRYQLSWRARTSLDTNYHGFVHLVDVAGQPLVQEDQLPGPFFQPPRLWDGTRWQPDSYLLRIPATAPSALYWPTVGLYDFETLARLPAWVDDGDDGLDAVRLPPLKVVNRQLPAHLETADVTIGDFATLHGYAVTLPADGLHAGDSFTVTLAYVAKRSAASDYVRFLQLYAPDRGVIAQQDAPPREGGNPTWSWQPGEVILDTVRLTVDARRAASGKYSLYMGMYDADDVSQRAPLFDGDGRPLADNWAPLLDIVVQ